MKTRCERALFKNFLILLDSGSISIIIMGKLTENLNQKIEQKTT